VGLKEHVRRERDSKLGNVLRAQKGLSKKEKGGLGGEIVYSNGNSAQIESEDFLSSLIGRSHIESIRRSQPKVLEGIKGQLKGAFGELSNLGKKDYGEANGRLEGNSLKVFNEKKKKPPL